MIFGGSVSFSPPVKLPCWAQPIIRQKAEGRRQRERRKEEGGRRRKEKGERRKDLKPL